MATISFIELSEIVGKQETACAELNMLKDNPAQLAIPRLAAETMRHGGWGRRW